MDPDLGVGPVEHGLPAQEVRIFHIRKSIFDLRLTAIGEDNLLIAPALLVGEQDAFPQLMFLELGEGGGIGPVSEFQLAAFFDHHVQDFRDVLARTNLSHLLGEAFAAIAFAFSARDRKSTRLNSSHGYISYAVFCLKDKK